MWPSNTMTIEVAHSMAATTVTDQAANALSEVQGMSDACDWISPQDMSWIREYASHCQATATLPSSAAQLERFNEVLRRATAMAARGEGMHLVDKLCELLHGVIRRATDADVAAGALMRETSRTYEYTLVILSSPKELTLASVALLLQSLSREIRFRELQVRLSIDLYISYITFSKDRFGSMCSDLLVYLNDIAPEMAPKPRRSAIQKALLNGNLKANHELFSDVVNGIHTIACWGLSHYGSSPKLADVRDSLRKLQENVWEQLIDGDEHLLAQIRIGAALQATTTPLSGNENLFSIQWLEEKRIIWRLLYLLFDMDDVPQVQEFVTILGEKGVVLQEDEFLELLRDSSGEPEQCEAEDQIHATMLELLDISLYSDYFLEFALEWLETRQANAVIDGSKIFNIGRKLLRNDKNRKWEKRFCTLLRRCASSISHSQLVECLKEVVDHYNTSYVTGSSEDSNFLEKDDKQAQLLQACSSADMVACISTDLIHGALTRTKAHIQKAESWKDKEIDLDVQMNASSTLTNALSTTNFPYTRHEMAKECLERLNLAKELSTGLNPIKSYCSTFASVIAGAMSAELETLGALKNESLLHCKVVQQVEELREKRAHEYDALRQEQYERLVKFAEACRKEEEDVIWDALIQKMKVLASVERACAGKDKDMSCVDILKRLVVNAEGACMQMEVKLSQAEGKHKESLERLPNNKCAVCYEKFSKKRKRACLDPCGHASACADCATSEWMRTKTCFICKTSIEKPIAIPYKLFF